MTTRIGHLRSDDHFVGSPLPILVTFMTPQPDMALHRHEFIELVMIIGGTGRHVLQDGAFPLAPGDVFAVLPGMAHGYDRCHKLELINILYDPTRLDLPRLDLERVPGYHALFTLEPRLRDEQSFGGRLHLDSARQHELRQMIDNLLLELRQAAEGCCYVATSWLMQIIAFTARCYGDSPSAQGRHLLGLADVMTYMEEHLDRELSVDELAEVAGVSVSTLQRFFKRALDATPVTYLNRLRVHRACELLRDRQRSVTQVASLVGIVDSSYFARIFRREMGCSPRSFRRSVLGLDAAEHG